MPNCITNPPRSENILIKTYTLTTVKIRLRNAKLFACIAIQKTLLRPQNKMKWMQWALTHGHWTEEDLKSLWTDESKFEIFGSKQQIFVRCSAVEKMLPNCVVPKVMVVALVWSGDASRAMELKILYESK